MPRESQHSVRAFLTGNPDKYRPIPQPDSSPLHEKEMEFRGKLLDAGLDDISANVLTLEFVYEWSLREISEYLQLTPNKTHEIKMAALGILREKNYNGK